MRPVSARLLRFVGIVVLSLIALATFTPNALAHAGLVSADPADGSSLKAPPTQVRLTFTDPIAAEFSTVTVIAPDGSPWQDGGVRANGSTVTIGVRPLQQAGKSQIGYRVVSADGPPTQGRTAFTLTAVPATPLPGVAATTAPPSAAALAPVAAVPPADGGAPVWPSRA